MTWVTDIVLKKPEYDIYRTHNFHYTGMKYSGGRYDNGRPRYCERLYKCKECNSYFLLSCEFFGHLFFNPVNIHDTLTLKYGYTINNIKLTCNQIIMKNVLK